MKNEEHNEQVALFQWASYYPEIRMFAIPNGGNRNIITATNLKAEGVKAGVPDIFLPLARGEYHGMFIEMKRKKGGRVTPEQKEWIQYLNCEGYFAVVARGCDEAIELIQDYLKNSLKDI